MKKSFCKILLITLSLIAISFAGRGKIEQIQVHFEVANPYIAVWFNNTDPGDTGPRMLYIIKNSDEFRFKILYSQLLASVNNSATVGIWPASANAQIEVITTTH